MYREYTVEELEKRYPDVDTDIKFTKKLDELDLDHIAFQHSVYWISDAFVDYLWSGPASDIAKTLGITSASVHKMMKTRRGGKHLIRHCSEALGKPMAWLVDREDIG